MRQIDSSRNQIQARSQQIPSIVNKQSLVAIILMVSLASLLLVSNSFAMSAAQQNQYVLEHSLKSQGLYANKQLQDKQFNKALAAFKRGENYLAKRLLLPLAQQQYTGAEFYMGMIYDIGQGVAKSPAKAVHWYQRAAQKGYHPAQHNLAVAYAKGVGVKQDLKKALRWWRRAARQGNTDSQYNLGIIYATGNELVKRDLLKAEKWWRKAAINGDAMAQYNLGALYANGEKKVTSYCEAIRWWQESARSGMSQAMDAIEVIKQRPDYNPC